MTIKSDILTIIERHPGITSHGIAEKMQDLGYYPQDSEVQAAERVAKILSRCKADGEVLSTKVKTDRAPQSINAWTLTTIPPTVAATVAPEPEPEPEPGPELELELEPEEDEVDEPDEEMASDTAELWTTDALDTRPPSKKETPAGWEPEWSPQCVPLNDVKTTVAAIKPLSAAMIYAGWLDNSNLDPVAFLAGIAFAENRHGIR